MWSALRMAAGGTSRPWTAARCLSTAGPLGNRGMGRPDLRSAYPGVLSLSDLRDRPGARKKAKRLGRGPGSGKGKTAGRGYKGQKARSGNKGLRDGSFIGGQTPLSKRLPKWGFTNNRFKQVLEEVNIEKVQQWIDRGRIDPTQPITMKVMFDTFLVNKIKHGVKLLNKPKQGEIFELPQPIYIEVTRASENAIKSVEDAGGTVVTTWYNRLGLKALLKPNSFLHPDLIPKRARPPPKRMAYYTNYENRGYLSPEMQYKLRGDTKDVARIHSTEIPPHLQQS